MMRLDGFEQSVEHDGGARRGLRRAEIGPFVVEWLEVASHPRKEKMDVGFGVRGHPCQVFRKCSAVSWCVLLLLGIALRS